ncbi:MAG: transposase [Muribaculaceae bacterium]|nr:transposase [Muribaculaceae bacterium]
MANTYCSVTVHLVFAVKNREALIPAHELNRFHAYLGGVIRKIDERCVPLAVGGTPNHVHVLLTLPPKRSISEIVKTIKLAGSRLVNEVLVIPFKFEWQRGYAAFAVSPSVVPSVCNYIARQMEHHHSMTLREEIIRMFNASGTEFDEKYIFDEV